MLIEVTIEGGEAEFNVLDGKGLACRRGTKGYLSDLKKQFGLSDAAIQEDCKPEMNLPETQTLEGDKLV